MESSGANPEDIIVPPVEGVAGGGTAYGWNDGGFHVSNLLKESINPSEVPTADLVHIWCMPSTANVGHQEMPRPLEPINLLAARNERESVQIAMRPKLTWGGSGMAGVVQVQGCDLCSKSGDRLALGKSVTLRRVVPILGVPDALVPIDLPTSQVSLFPGETTAIWVSIDVPGEQPPGQYEGEITITATKLDKEYIKSAGQGLTRAEKHQLYRELRSCLDSVEQIDEKPLEEVISDTVIEDRFGVQHGTEEWYNALDRHFKWLLQYKISPYFCRWGDSMRVLTYTSPWPADHPKSDEYFSDPRLAAYAVPYCQAVSRGTASEDYLQKEIEILRTKPHWKKAYFYLWDEPLNSEQYDSIRRMASEIHAQAPDARILTTYYCGPSDMPLAPNAFEAFLKVPKYLRPHTQIYCTSEWVLGNREDLVKDIIAELEPADGEEWWTYVCMGPSDPHPNWHLGMRGTQHRAVMWRVWKEGGTGFLYWGANCYEKATVPSAEIRFRRGLPPGDGVLFYPGEVFSSSQEPVASIRLERILSGLQDYEYLKLYSSKYGRDEGLALLEKTGLYLGPERYTLEHMPVDMMRGEIFNTCRS
ncbi:uncharacterized protein LOC115669811 isoform X2 [Syzygium oleosum]|uniref:uncharacterized protein LOC115669811 isoform X2 n=1 Tax=Syzygium oleosum TaxID=219896 RepID=UPI0024B8EA8F|nr:uncharacterized protein LOC115669811 isoform X2 [Syzygium oleosum]